MTPVAPESPELEPVRFRVVGTHAYGGIFGENELHFGRDRHGVLRFLVAANLKGGAATTVGRMGGGQGGDTGISRTRLEEDMRAAFRNQADVWKFYSLATDVEGNIFVGGTVRERGRYHKHPVYLWYSADASRSVPVADPRSLLAFGRGYSEHYDPTVLRPTPPGNAWLVVRTGEDSCRVAFFRRRPDGQFGFVEVTPTLPPNLPRTPKLGWFALGPTSGPDWNENLVFYADGAIWRLAPSGQVTPHVWIDLPSEGVIRKPLVVTYQGDIWIPFNQVLRSASSGSLRTGTMVTSFYAGDRARWVRIRVDGDTVHVGEISDDDMLAALRAAGARLSGGILRTARATVDYATGGLEAYEGHNDLWFRILPLD